MRYSLHRGAHLGGQSHAAIEDATRLPLGGRFPGAVAVIRPGFGLVGRCLADPLWMPHRLAGDAFAELVGGHGISRTVAQGRQPIGEGIATTSGNAYYVRLRSIVSAISLVSYASLPESNRRRDGPPGGPNPTLVSRSAN
jgi:hypothetical protein